MDRYNPRGRHGGGMHIEKIYDNSKVPVECPYYWSEDSVCGNRNSDRYLMICKFACKEWKKMKKMSEEMDVSQNCIAEREKKQRVPSKVSVSSKQNQQKKIRQLTLEVEAEKQQRKVAETVYHNSEKEIIALRKALENEQIKLNDKEARIEILQKKLQASQKILIDKEQQINILQKKWQESQQQTEKVCDEDIPLNTINYEENDIQNEIEIGLTILFLIIIIVLAVK